MQHASQDRNDGHEPTVQKVHGLPARQTTATNLRVGSVDDRIEHDADVIAARVTRVLRSARQTLGPTVARDDQQLEFGRVRRGAMLPAGPPRASTPRIQPMSASGAVIRRRFVGGAPQREWTLDEVRQWCNDTQLAIPDDLDPILQILCASDEKIPIDRFVEDLNPGATFLKYLTRQDRAIRDTVFLDKETPIPGKLDPRTMKPQNWALGDAAAHAPAERSAEWTTLAHVTKRAANLDSTKVEPSHGSNAGEFGYAFYLTTGHAMQPQQMVSEKWGEQKKSGEMVYPKEIVNFRIANTTLRQSVNREADLVAFLVHMLQTPSGYPEGMSEQRAVEMMNRINRLGHVLIFPDRKDCPVAITAELEQDWSTYTEGNSGGSDHYLVIGPNRPLELDGIRQVAVRGEFGSLFINLAKRSQQKMK